MEREIIFEEQAISGFQLFEMYGMYAKSIIHAPFALTVGENYIVAWDDDEYPVTAVDISALFPGGVAVGNGSGFGLPGNNEPFIVAVFETDITLFVLDPTDTRDTHSFGAYKEIKEETPVNIILRNPMGEEEEYPMRPMIEVDTTDGNTALYSKGEVLDSITIEPDFSAGDMTVSAPDGYLVKSAVIAKPSALVPENIAKDVDVAGIVGTLEAGGGDVPCVFEEHASTLKYDYNLATGTRDTACSIRIQMLNAEIKSVRCTVGYVGSSSASGIQATMWPSLGNLGVKDGYTITVGTSSITIYYPGTVNCNYRYGIRVATLCVSFTLKGVVLKETAEGIMLYADSNLTKFSGAFISKAKDIKVVDLSESLVPALNSNVLSGCENLKKVILPSTITTVYGDAFAALENVLNGLVIDLSRCTAVPNGYNLNFIDGIPNLQILISSALYDEWVAAANWSTIASKIVAV